MRPMDDQPSGVNERTARYAIDLVCLIGVLPSGGTVERLASGFDLDSLLHFGMGDVRTYRAPEDVLRLSMDQRADFIAGAAKLYRRFRNPAGNCLCNFPPFVTLPMTAFATLVAAAHPRRFAAYTDLVSIGYECADKIGLMDKLPYEEFVGSLVARDRGAVNGGDLEIRERRAAASILESYGIRLLVGDHHSGTS